MLASGVIYAYAGWFTTWIVQKVLGGRTRLVQAALAGFMCTLLKAELRRAASEHMEIM